MEGLTRHLMECFVSSRSQQVKVTTISRRRWPSYLFSSEMPFFAEYRMNIACPNATRNQPRCIIRISQKKFTNRFKIIKIKRNSSHLSHDNSENNPLTKRLPRNHTVFKNDPKLRCHSTTRQCLLATCFKLSLFVNKMFNGS